ncbi:MAG: EamA family transporter [Clostridia bacterium]|nr:EamA family transporter [Clostridia bacterium]
MKMKSSAAPILLILLSGLLWGTLGTFVTYLRQAGFSTMQIVFVRAAVTTVLLGLYILVTDKSKFRFRLCDAWIFIGTGIISFTAFTVCNQIAMQLCSLSIAAALLYTSPAFILIFSAILFGERLTVQKITAIAVTVFGCFLVSGLLTPGAAVSVPGILAGVVSGLCYGLYSIFGRYGVEKYDTMTVTFYTFVLVSLAALPFANVGNLAEICISPTAPWVVPTLLAFGPVTCLVPYLAYTAGLRGTEPGTAGILATVEPVVSTVLSVVIFHEAMNWQKIAGIVCILGSVVIVNVGGRERKRKQNK